MPWYAITSLDMAGKAHKREILHRDSVQKIWEFLAGRATSHRIPTDTFGFFVSEATTDETWDWDIDEPHSIHNPRAIEVDLVFGEDLAPRN